MFKPTAVPYCMLTIGRKYVGAAEPPDTDHVQEAPTPAEEPKLEPTRVGSPLGPLELPVVKARGTPAVCAVPQPRIIAPTPVSAMVGIKITSSMARFLLELTGF